jgi:hypothetical protein
MKAAAILALMTLTGCSESRFDRVWGASRGVLASATKVEAYRVAVPEKRDLLIWSWPMKSGPVALDAAASKRLVDLLLDEKSYEWGPPKACLPEPGVKLRFSDGKRAVSILVCFDCADLFIRSPDGKDKIASFVPSSRSLAAIVAPLFPKDPEIQGLLSPR